MIAERCLSGTFFFSSSSLVLFQVSCGRLSTLTVSVVVVISQIERCYYFLQACVETAQRKEPVDGRLVQFLLSNPTNDGGQWDMLVNLIG